MNFKKWISGTLAVTGVAAMSAFMQPATALAQCERCPEVGQQICCPGSSKADLEALGYTLTIESLTNGCFLITSCTEPPPGCPTGWYTELEIQDFQGTGNDPNLGNFRWRNDPDRQSSPATLKSLSAASQFPAYGTISFYAIAEVDGIPGVFKSVEQVHLVNPNVNSFAPFEDELFYKESDEPVRFINDETGDELLLYTLTSLLTP